MSNFSLQLLVFVYSMLKINIIIELKMFFLLESIYDMILFFNNKYKIKLKNIFFFKFQIFLEVFTNKI